MVLIIQTSYLNYVYGFESKLYNRLADYVANKKFYVHVNDFYSCEAP